MAVMTDQLWACEVLPLVYIQAKETIQLDHNHWTNNDPSDHQLSRRSAAETAAGIDDPPADGEMPWPPEAAGNAAARAPLGDSCAGSAPASRAAVRRGRPAPPERRRTPVPPRRRLQDVVAGGESARAWEVRTRRWSSAAGVGWELILRGGHRRLPRVHQE